MKKQISILILIIASMSSCVITQKQKDKFCSHCPQIQTSKDSIIQSDSVSEKIVYKDTTIFITKQGPIQYLENPCKELCDSFGNLKSFDILKKVNGIREEIKSVGNSIVVDCAADSLQEIVRGLNRKISEMHFKKEFQEKKEVKLIKEICLKKHHSGFDSFTNYFFWIAAGILLIYFGWKYFLRFHIPK